ncbi:MAG: hydroxyisourate hydrolase [Jatrophihabitantaceae bacterium]
MSVSTHVLDAVRGAPAAGVPVSLSAVSGAQIAAGVTDADGRVAPLAGDLDPGVYRLRFGVDGPFYPEVVIAFRITDGAAHHHVPLLLSPYAYSTYRGS